VEIERLLSKIKMKMTSWKSFAAATLALVAGASAQTGQLMDLGGLLASEKNLTTFYGLIQVRCVHGRLEISKLEKRVWTRGRVYTGLTKAQKYPNILLKLPSYQGVTVSQFLSFFQIANLKLILV